MRPLSSRAIEQGRDGMGIIAHGRDLCTQLAEVLHQVVGKGVVVIDHQQPRGLP